MQQGIERVVCRLVFAPIFPAAVQMQRQTRNRFSKDAHTGIHSSQLHCGFLCDGLTRSSWAHQKTMAAADGIIFNFGFEQPLPNLHIPPHKNRSPRSSYTDAFPAPLQRIARSSAMTKATEPSMRSTARALSILMFPAGSVRTTTLSMHQRSTG